jgi:hypothetical protein
MNKVSLKALVALHRAILRDYQQFFVLGPAQSFDRSFVPLLE